MTTAVGGDPVAALAAAKLRKMPTSLGLVAAAGSVGRRGETRPMEMVPHSARSLKRAGRASEARRPPLKHGTRHALFQRGPCAGNLSHPAYKASRPMDRDERVTRTRHE